jgi:hypothetical protein
MGTLRNNWYSSSCSPSDVERIDLSIEKEWVMGMVKEVVDILKEVAEGIEHIKKIADTVQTGTEYLKHHHPQVRADLSALCSELQNTSIAVAAASAVLTNFRFTISEPARETELPRFNDHLIAHKEKAAKMGRSLHAMRGHCKKIGAHVIRLQEERKLKGLKRLLQLLGIDSTERDQEFLENLQDIYDEEMQSYLLVDQLSRALQLSLDDIAAALGPAGKMLPENLPAAAALLGVYAEEFGKLESKSLYLTLNLQETINALDE